MFQSSWNGSVMAQTGSSRSMENNSQENSQQLEKIKTAIEFIRPIGLLTLNSIPAAGGVPDGKTFELPAELTEAIKWAVDRNRCKRNVYFGVNPPTGKIDKKLKKEQIANVELLHVDIDPDIEKYRDYAVARAAVLELGDTIKATPKGDFGFPVAIIETNQQLTMAGTLNTETGEEIDPKQIGSQKYFSGNQTFLLKEIDEDSTRLIFRMRIDWNPSLSGTIINRGIVEPLSFVMARKTLLNLGRRAQNLTTESSGLVFNR